MRAARAAVLAAALAALTAAVPLATLAACNPFLARAPRPVHRVPAGDGEARWTATLVPTGTPVAAGVGGVRGAAAMRPGFDDAHTYASVELAGAAPGGAHPWQLRRGRCGADDGAFGALGGRAAGNAYPPLAVDGGGRAAGSTTVPGVTPGGGRYYVRVGASAADPASTIACGDFSPPR